ncbi:hypothetical protein Tco_0477420 [Tanacetum coccineum]
MVVEGGESGEGWWRDGWDGLRNCRGTIVELATTIIVGRDSFGSILHVYGRLCYVLSPPHAEALAFVESDSKASISLSSAEIVPPWSIAALLADIRLWSKNIELSFSWTSRDNNQVALYVARLTSSTLPFNWDVSFPHKLNSLARNEADPQQNQTNEINEILVAFLWNSFGRYMHSFSFVRSGDGPKEWKGIMEREPDIENMTLTEYLEYEVKKERRLRRNDVKINKYYPLPPLLSCFQPSQPHTKCGYESLDENKEVDIDSMTIAEYELYVAKQSLRKNRLNDHTDGFTSDFSPCTPNPLPDDKELSFEEEYNIWVRIGVKNLRKQKETKVKECDEGDIYDIWDITVEDVERLRKILTLRTISPTPTIVVQRVSTTSSPRIKVVRDEEPNNDVGSISIQVPDVMDGEIQPSIPQSIHTPPPDKDYVAPATKSILDELLEEFGDEILNVTVVDEGDDFNPTKNLEELERLLAKDPQSYLTEIQVHSLIINTNDESEPFIHTQPLSLLYRAFKSSKSSTKPYKVEREMTSPPWILEQRNGIS